MCAIRSAWLIDNALLVCPIFCSSEIVSVAQRVMDRPRRRRRGCGKVKAFFAFHFPMPQCSFGLPCSRRRRSVAQRRVRPDSVEVDAPAFGQHTQFLHRVEDLSIQELIPQLRVEALAMAIFPGRTRFDIQRFRSPSIQPLA